MKTIKLYDIDSFCKEFTATVLKCEKNGENYEIILDRTAFFPEGGGQYSDTGIIGNANVLDVQIEDNIIRHITDAPLTVNKTYGCKLNFEERFDKMQQHSGEHIISGIVNTLYGYNNTGFHLSDNIVTLDFDGFLSADDIKRIEILANEAVHKNAKITAEYPDNETLKDTTYRSKLDLAEDVRLVTIDGYDVCACCAPHVKNTGEIGIIKLLTTEKHKNGVRITIKCGMRAVLDYQNKHNLHTEISAKLKSPIDENAAAVNNLLAENERLKYEITGLKRKLCEIKLAEISRTDKNIIMPCDDADIQALRYIADKGAQKCNTFVALGSTNGGYNFVACSKVTDLKALLPEIKEKLGLTGGGSSSMLQGKISADITAVEEFFR